MQIKEKIIKFLDKEDQNRLFYGSISYIIAIILFLSLPHQYSSFYLLLVPILLLILNKYGNLYSRVINFIGWFFIFGILIASFSKHQEQNIILEEYLETTITGYIEAIEPKNFGKQLLVQVNKENNTELFNHLQNISVTKIRLNLYDNEYVQVGDTIIADCKLLAPPEKVITGGYDFRQRAIFEGISAVGKIVNISIKSGAHNSIENLRYNFSEYLLNLLGPDQGSVISALIVGMRSHIPKEILDNMRNAGLAHILAVSGLHLSLVGILTFILFRFLLNIHNYTAFRLNPRSISAVIAFFACLAYLFISGKQVAATRAFMMTSLFFIAILIDRLPSPKRALSIAAILVLAYNPSYVFHPSFQLSFAAVLALISSYSLSRRLHSYMSGGFMSDNISVYLATLCLSSLIASIATGPFVVGTFYTYPNYSVLSNLFAVPLTSFVIMPLSMLGFILYPLGLSDTIFQIDGYFVSLMTKYAGYISNLPGSILYFGYLKSWVILLYFLGLSLLCVAKQRSIRIFAMLLILLSFITSFMQEKPLMVISPKKYSIGYVSNNNEFLVLANNIQNFTFDYWAKWFGFSNFMATKHQYQNQIINLKNDYKAHIFWRYAYCLDTDIIINFSKAELRCPASRVYNIKDYDENFVIFEE